MTFLLLEFEMVKQVSNPRTKIRIQFSGRYADIVGSLTGGCESAGGCWRVYHTLAGNVCLDVDNPSRCQRWLQRQADALVRFGDRDAAGVLRKQVRELQSHVEAFG